MNHDQHRQGLPLCQRIFQNVSLQSSRPNSMRSVWTLMILVLLLGTSLFLTVQVSKRAHAAPSSLMSWVGESSTMPGGSGGPDNQGQWVQDAVDSAVVQPDGTIWTTSGWDEGHHEYGEYRNGQVVGPGENLGNNNHNLNYNSSRTVTDTYGHTWNVQNVFYVGGNEICRADNSSICITGGSGFRPNALAMANDGTLMVGDNGPDQQIKFYDVSSGTPSSTPIRTFGQQGGAWAGPTPGLTGALRFQGIWGTGMDSSGNIYIIGNFPGGGTWMRSLQPNGTMNWQLYGKIWVSNSAPDMSTDGTDVYDHNALYKMDYTQTTPGKEVTGDFPSAVTVDPWAHPDDPRLITSGCCDANGGTLHLPDTQAPINASYSFTFYVPRWIRDCYGHKYLLTTAMFGGAPTLYVQQGLMWVNVPLNINRSDWSWAFYADTNCDMWVASSDGYVSQYPATGVDSSGNLTYGSAVNYPQVTDFTEVDRIQYDRQNDNLYLSGYTAARPSTDYWGDAGSEFKRYASWKSSPHNDFTIDLPYDIVKNSDGSDDFEDTHLIRDWDISGNYLFAGFITRNDQTNQRGSPAIYSLADGSRTNLTTTDPVPVNSPGWIDVKGITSGLRANGEYIVLIEEDGYNKSLLYRWCPSGNCPENGSGSTPTPTPLSPTPTPGQLVTAINAGGSASGSFVADTDYDQGNQYSDTSSSIDTSGVSNPAPQAVYQTCRWNSSFTYTIPNLKAGASYTVRLHWAELSFQSAGLRTFNVAMNGSTVLSNFDVYATAGYKKALVKTFTTTANSNGKIIVTFTRGSADNPFVSGIEILTA